MYTYCKFLITPDTYDCFVIILCVGTEISRVHNGRLVILKAIVGHFYDMHELIVYLKEWFKYNGKVSHYLLPVVA